jgi:2-polyprenyl-6-hydroxyphenyl methylase/3-demethylubiquinone-9 3-methyltransferase
MFRSLTTTQAHSTADIKNFFDSCAQEYREQHGNPQRLLNYRISLMKRYARLCTDDVVLDVGCGNGHHLFAVVEDIRHGIGVDLSAAMIELAQERLRDSTLQSKLTFLNENVEHLSVIDEQSVDLAICIGALEHMIDKVAVLEKINRALKPGGRFFCLTLNGEYFWYQRLAPSLGLDIKHLSTDRFLKRGELEHLITESGFYDTQTGYWTFIPRGDMPWFFGLLLQGLDNVGRSLRMNSLRGGLWACAWKK